MSAEEKRRCILAAKNGDAHARHQLIVGHLPLVLNVARRFAAYTTDLTELVEEGNLALVRSADGFEPGDYEFSTYAFTAIRRAIIGVLRHERRFRALSLDQTAQDGVSSLKDDLLSRDSSTPAEVAEHNELLAQVQEARETLNEREKEAMHLRVTEALSLTEAAQKMGITKQGVKDLQERALRKLRRLLRHSFEIEECYKTGKLKEPYTKVSPGGLRFAC